MTALRFRRFQPPDADAIWQLHHRALDEAGADLGPGPWDEDLRAIESTYVATGGEFLVGERDGVIVAMGALRPLDASTAELKRMRVAPSLQRQGIGRALLAVLEEAARERGFRLLRLDTMLNQAAAIRLYTGAGYREVERHPGPGRFVTLFFEKRLG